MLHCKVFSTPREWAVWKKKKKIPTPSAEPQPLYQWQSLPLILTNWVVWTWNQKKWNNTDPPDPLSLAAKSLLMQLCSSWHKTKAAHIHPPLRSYCGRLAQDNVMRITACRSCRWRCSAGIPCRGCSSSRATPLLFSVPVCGAGALCEQVQTAGWRGPCKKKKKKKSRLLWRLFCF